MSSSVSGSGTVATPLNSADAVEGVAPPKKLALGGAQKHGVEEAGYYS